MHPTIHTHFQSSLLGHTNTILKAIIDGFWSWQCLKTESSCKLPEKMEAGAEFQGSSKLACSSVSGELCSDELVVIHVI